MKMGEAASLLKALSCSDCARYVCNSCSFHSQCFENCCEIDFVTEEVEISDGDEIEFEVQGCCLARKS